MLAAQLCFAPFLLLVFNTFNNLSLCHEIADFSECGVSGFDPFSVQSEHNKFGLINHVYRGQPIVDDKSLPWMATVLQSEFDALQNKTKFNPICTATIIGPRHILTALHCLEDGQQNSEYRLSYGAAQSSKQRQSFSIKSVKYPPNAKYFTFTDVLKNKRAEIIKSDLAIIKSKQAIIFSPRVRPICLFSNGASNSEFSTPKKFVSQHIKKERRPFIVAGWGFKKPKCLNESQTPNDQLLYGTMRMISKEKCRLQYAKTQDMPEDDPINAIEKRLYEYHLVDKICVVPEPSVTEPGDSGSPLLSKIGQYNWVQVGVLHGGNDKRCAPNDVYSTKGLYSAYTPIDCDWIADVTDGEVKCRGW